MLFISVENAEAFVVGFVQTTYTVLESAGSLEVCVQLTRPDRDILDETVTVSVVDNSSSIYIPPGATLASIDCCCSICPCRDRFCLCSIYVES